MVLQTYVAKPAMSGTNKKKSYRGGSSTPSTRVGNKTLYGGSSATSQIGKGY